MTTFLERLQAGEVLVADGATGTNLQQRGLERGLSSEVWVMERPQEILRLHRDFIAAGANIILTSTFGATRPRLEAGGDPSLAGRAAEVNRRAVELAKQAAHGTATLVAASMGPTGQLLKPLGTLDEADAEIIFGEQARALVEAGADLLVVETQFDLSEARAAVRAARAASGGLPVVCSFSYDRGTRTMMGVRPSQMAAELEELVDVLGINCGRSLDENLKSLQELRRSSSRPIWFKPNAGLPRVDELGNSSYDVTPEMMGARTSEWLQAGAQVVGGCCGTSPQHLREIARAVGERAVGIQTVKQN
jgi:5-methyltetrahydrofolate--homocysteine methyltransferase